MMLGSAPTQTSDAKNVLAERTCDQRVADLLQRAAARRLDRSGHRVSNATSLAHGVATEAPFLLWSHACPGFSSCPLWLVYLVFPNVDVDMGMFGTFLATGRKFVFFFLEKGSFSNADPCTNHPGRRLQVPNHQANTFSIPFAINIRSCL